MHNSIKRLLKYTGQNITRNGLLSIATIIVMTLIAFFVNILGSVYYLADYSIESINKKVDLTIELKEEVDIDAPEITDLKKELEMSNAFVTKISKEQALKDLKQVLPDLGNFLEKYRQNPLPASLYVTTSNLKDYDHVSQIIEKSVYKNLINYDQNENSFSNQKKRIYNILDISDSAKRFVSLLIVLFFVISAIIIFNTIQIVIHNRKEEINIMTLVGASKLFVALPFVLEGVFYAVSGVLCGFLLYFLSLQIVHHNFSQILYGGAIQSFSLGLWTYYNTNFLSLLTQQGIVFIMLGAVSSFIALSRFIRLIFFIHSKSLPQRGTKNI